MSDIETLIIAIEGYPCLWDLNHENYHNREAKDLAWESICKETDGEWENYDSVQRINTSNNLKKKWTHIRDYYRKDLQKFRKKSSGVAGATKQKRYVYSPYLEFLRPTFEKRRLQGLIDDQDDPDPIAVEDQTESNELNIIMSPSSSSSCATKPATKEKKSNNKKTHNNTEAEDLSNSILQMLKRNENAKQDDDANFLLSFRGDMQRMNSDQKIEFKIGMLQLIKKINDEQQIQVCIKSEIYSD